MKMTESKGGIKQHEEKEGTNAWKEKRKSEGSLWNGGDDSRHLEGGRLQDKW